VSGETASKLAELLRVYEALWQFGNLQVGSSPARRYFHCLDGARYVALAQWMWMSGVAGDGIPTLAKFPWFLRHLQPTQITTALAVCATKEQFTGVHLGISGVECRSSITSPRR
jgi:hypothetical protein